MTKPWEQEWVIEQDGGMNPSMPFRIVARIAGRVVTTARRLYLALAGDAEAARFISAAPDMARALNKALRDSGCDGDLCMHQWHDDARAALRKAGVLP